VDGAASDLISAEQNEVFTAVGAGTPMGELLRRYWHPVAAVSEFDRNPVKPVRLLGEQLVLYRMPDGRYGLTASGCPHRGADLSYGWVEPDGLRCAYHGWVFDPEGRCVSQPYEDCFAGAVPFRDKVGITAYRARPFAGLVWAYLGPGEPPLIPDFEPFGWTNGFVEVIFTELECNWFQCYENNVDPVHFEWLHTNLIAARMGLAGEAYGPAHVDIAFQEFEHGIACGRRTVPVGRPVGPVARTNEIAESGILCLWPNLLYAGGSFEWRVPVDDGRTLNVVRQYSPRPEDLPEWRQETVPAWYGPVADPETGRWITTHVLNQDFAAWLGQGRIADRTTERLGRSDIGLTMLRRSLLKSIERMERGEDPPGVIRDPERNADIPLPIAGRELFVKGLPRSNFEKRLERAARTLPPGDQYALQAGQPPHVQRMFEEAMGLPRPAVRPDPARVDNEDKR
jgi:5,5'-dehydrodivanillate O-demethylase oxygenase subunit